MKNSRLIDSYIETLLWSEANDDGEPLDNDYGPEDISPGSLLEIANDCSAFYREALEIYPEGETERIAHDFCLTRNRHGAGFWDGDYPEPQGAKLTQASHAYGSQNLYVGDDGLLHVS